MYGDARPYPVALITVDAEEIATLGPVSRERLAELVQGVVDEVNARHSRVEQVKRFAILDRDLSQEAGELTPTLKVKRAVVQANHAEVIESLYR